MPALSRDSILKADDLRPTVEPVEVPEWGGTVYVRAMTGTERDNFEGNVDRVRGKTLRAFTVVTCACDEQGNDLFKPEDVDALGKKSSLALDRVFEAACRINQLRQKDVEALEKKSEGAPGSGSPAASRHLCPAPAPSSSSGSTRPS